MNIQKIIHDTKLTHVIAGSGLRITRQVFCFTKPLAQYNSYYSVPYSVILMELPSGAGRALLYVDLTLTKPTQISPEGRQLRKF
jgi:hypothetical protein